MAMTVDYLSHLHLLSRLAMDPRTWQTALLHPGLHLTLDHRESATYPRPSGSNTKILFFRIPDDKKKKKKRKRDDGSDVEPGR